MGKNVLILGGARSGKSRHGEALAEAWPGPHVYIATAEAGDAEMEARIAAHRARRGAGWTTREAPRDLFAALARTDDAGVRLVDCLTLWLSNLVVAGTDWEAPAERLAEALPGQLAPVILISNEVGMGLVPDSRLGREFRDAQGRLNQMIAEAADEVRFVAAGQALRLKPPAPETG